MPRRTIRRLLTLALGLLLAPLIAAAPPGKVWRIGLFLVGFENQTARAAQAVTAEIPIIFLGVSDPVAAGFVHSLAHPGGNLTGFEAFTLELPDKKLELFKALVPLLRRVLV